MEAIGIICEYNPLHLGHKKQIDIIRAAHPHSGIVCLMSGNYVQRGAPALLDKSLRAQAAILSGADLVLELPLTASLSSAEGFAMEGVRILGSFCDGLCFGAETKDPEVLRATAQALLSPQFPEYLREELDKGVSFPVARQAALQAMGLQHDTLTHPNDILATEYCKAILQLGVAMTPMTIHRQGNYHDAAPNRENPSATALRNLMLSGEDWESFAPESAKSLFASATLHTTAAAEKAILFQLRTMSDEAFRSLPYSSEGLWRKLMRNARTLSTLEQIIAATKSKRYTRSRLDRMVMCAFLGITEKDIASPAPYARVLALNDKGRELLKSARKIGLFPNVGQWVEHPYQELEYRANTLYSLFATKEEPLCLEQNRRIFYKDNLAGGNTYETEI
ncbi:MAG: nucleotidyltransferase family protein [Oscillospiraceae bacterium]|nr:nucleotidyltransferase family protein [Oscillospiraceae bacterium]